MTHHPPRIARRCTPGVREWLVSMLGALVLASWFALYLEIGRFHHVEGGRLSDVLLPSSGSSRPGAFVRIVVAGALALPLLFVGALVYEHRTRLRRPQLTARVAILIGAALVVLGVVNQLIRHSAVTLDPTLRTGNGGFIVVGAAMLGVGLMLLRRHPRRRMNNGDADANAAA